MAGYLACGGAILYLLLSRPLMVSKDNINLSPSNNANAVKAAVPAEVVPPDPKILDKVTSGSIVDGIDVSHDQGQVDWGKVAKANIDFVYLKASDGITYQDPAFNRNTLALSQQKMLVGAYHFFEANDDANKQAQNFLTTIKDKSLTLTPMVDIELTKDVPSSEIQQRLKTFLSIVEKETGCKPMLYSYGDFWTLNIGKSFNEYPFWLADYNTTMTIPAGLENVVLWQYSSKGDVSGIQGDVDLDRSVKGGHLKQIQCSPNHAGN